MEALTLKEIMELGLQGILLVAVIALWRRLNQFVDAWIAYLQKRADAGESAAQKALESSSTIPLQRRQNGH